MEELKTGLYIRVSTDMQAEEGYSIQSQKEKLRGYCLSKGIKKFDFYIDGGFTGSNIERPELERLIKDVKAKKLNHVAVYKLDRLSRSQKDTLFLIEDVFLKNNVGITSLVENLDTSTPTGRMMIGILSAFAQLERETIRERTSMGMVERVKSGLWMGGGRVPYGYDYDRASGVLVPNEIQAENVRKMYDLYLAGYSPDYISKLLGMKYDRIVKQILTRKTNIGIIEYNGVEYKGKHTPLVDNDTFYRTIEAMELRKNAPNTKSEYLFTGLLVCGSCGAKMRYQKWGKKVKIYCYSQQKSKEYLIKDKNCNNEKYLKNDIEDVVINDLFKFAVSKSKIETNKLDTEKLIKNKIEKCDKKLEKLYNIFAESESDDVLLQTIKKVKKEREKLKKELENEIENRTKQKDIKKIKEEIKDIKSVWDFISQKEKIQIIKKCIKEVKVSKENIKITYNF